MKMIKLKVTRPENCNHYHVTKGTVIDLDLEEYVQGVVASEIGNAHIEACKAQAIAARTYVQKKKIVIDDSSIDQAFRVDRMIGAAYPNAYKAVEETVGMVLFYGGNIIDTCSYSASNGGRTTSAKTRWGSERAWQIEQDDPWDLAATGGKKTGHGVGMSQKGAMYAAQHGVGYEEILHFYYPGCKIKKAGGEEVANTKAEKVIAWAKERVGCPYVYGGTGKECTVAYRNQQANQYPESAGQIKQNCQRMSGGKSSCAGCKWYDAEKKEGKPCYDCAQLTRWAMNAVGITLPSGATSQWKKAEWEEKGVIATLPDKVCQVYRQDKDGTMGHTGIYLGDGTVIDARGSKYGVLHNTIEEYGRWTHWGIPVGLYGDNEESTEMEEAVMIGTVTGGNLNLRNSATKTASIIASMPDKCEIEILVRGDEWSKVRYQGKTGYAMSKYITFDEREEPAEGYDVVIHCASAAERELLLAQLHKAETK